MRCSFNQVLILFQVLELMVLSFITNLRKIPQSSLTIMRSTYWTLEVNILMALPISLVQFILAVNLHQPSKKRLTQEFFWELSELKGLLGLLVMGTMELILIFLLDSICLMLVLISSMELVMVLALHFVFMKDLLEFLGDKKQSLKKECAYLMNLASTKMVNSVSESKMSSWSKSTPSLKDSTALKT